MISKIDTTLKTYLIKELGEPADTELDFSFKLPDRGWLKSSQNSKNWINIYLLEVKENLELRNNEWQRNDDIDRVNQKKSPSYVDLYYLITFYNKEKKSEVEHQYLESVLIALFDFSNLAPEHITDIEFLKQMTLELFPKPYIDDQLGFQFWNAIDQDARPYIPLKITIPLESKVSRSSVRVEEKHINYNHLNDTLFTVSGDVLFKKENENNSLKFTKVPIESVTIELHDKGGNIIQDTKTDRLGKFAFKDLFDRELILVAQAEGYVQLTINLRNLSKNIYEPMTIIMEKN